MKMKTTNKPKLDMSGTKKTKTIQVIKASQSTKQLDENVNMKSSFSFKPLEKNPSSLSELTNPASKKQETKKITTNNPASDRSKNLLNQLEKGIFGLQNLQDEENYRKKQVSVIKREEEERKNKEIMKHSNIDLKEKSISLNQTDNNFVKALHDNYISLQDLDQKKNDHRSKIAEVERHFAEKKKLCDYEIGAYSKLTGDYLLSNLELTPPRKKRKDTTSSTRGRKQERKTFNQSLSMSLSKSKSSTGFDMINAEEEEFVRRYKDYLARTHYLQDKFKDNLTDEDVEWDHRGIKSQNYRTTKKKMRMEESDTEYSYYSISADGFDSQDLSVDISFDKDEVKRKKRKPPQKVKRETKKQFSPFPELNSKLGFFRMVFSVLDRNKHNFITKTQLRYGLKLDLDILKDVGYLSHNSFYKNLRNFETKSDQLLTEEEFLFLIFDKIEAKNLFMKYWRQYCNLIEDLNIHVRQTSEDKNISKDQSTFATKNQNKVIENLNNMEYLNNPKNQLIITYKDYKSFTDVYRYKTDIKFTIPEPFNFTFIDYDQRKKDTINYILEERKRKEDEIIYGHPFKANPLNRRMFLSDLGLGNVIAEEKAKRMKRIEKLKEKIIQEMKPFSFFEDDEKRYKEKLIQQCEPPRFTQFRANPVSWTSQIKIYHDIIKKEKLEREQRIKQRSNQLLFASRLPPRMEMHEKEKRERARSAEIKTEKKDIRPLSVIRAKPIPDFQRLQDEFFNMLEAKKLKAKSNPTNIKPFNFHPTKKNVYLHRYLDRENNPDLKNPQTRCNIEDIIQRIQRKPKVEPATTKSLNLLMAARRKEMEDKEKKSHEKMIEDLQRKEKQNRLKDRVVNSKHIVDNAKALDEKKKKHQEEFKNNLIDQKNKYEQELARRLDRVYNKPLMFETSNNSEKFTLAKNMQDRLNNLLSDDEDENYDEDEDKVHNRNFSQGNKVDTVEEEEEDDVNQEEMEEEDMME